MEQELHASSNDGKEYEFNKKAKASDMLKVNWR